jgi:hypothetical protein
VHWILIGYMFLFIHRPFEIWTVLGDLHFERLYMLGTVLAVLIYPKKRWLGDRQHWFNFAFMAAVLLCWLASPWMAVGQDNVENYFKVVVFYFLFIIVIHDEKALKRMLLAFLIIMFVYMSHSLREYIGGRHTFRMGIARMIGVDKTLGDPNSFGASIVYALPFVVPFWLTSPSRRLRWFLLAYIALSFVCIGLTGSRSSFLGLLFWAAWTVARSRRRIALAFLAVFLAPLLWVALPPSLQNRFETIIHPEVGPANAIVSGEDRLEGLRIGWELYNRSPITGVGPGAWQPATGKKLESHNLIGQMLAEMGTIGAVTFLGVLFGFWMNLRGIRRTYHEHPEWGRDFLYYVRGAVGMGVVLLLFEGSFGHNLFRFSWLWYSGFLIVTRHCVQQRLNAAADEAEPYFSPHGGWAMTRYVTMTLAAIMAFGMGSMAQTSPGNTADPVPTPLPAPRIYEGAPQTSKPFGSWERTAGEFHIILSFEAERLYVTVLNKSEQFLASLEGDYGVTKDSFVFGMITGIEVTKEECEALREFDALAYQDEPFCMRFRVDDDVLTVKEVKIRGLEDRETRQLVLGRFRKAQTHEPPSERAGYRLVPRKN